MTSITDVPIDDIKLFLFRNMIKIPVKDKDIYDTAFNLIIERKGNNHPDSLVDWIIAYNLFNEKRQINRYAREEIDFLSQQELKNLAESLDIFESNDIKQSIINV